MKSGLKQIDCKLSRSKGELSSNVSLAFAAQFAQRSIILSIIVFMLVGSVSCGRNAKNIKLDGLRDFVCRAQPYDTATQACGRRSVWLEADSGLRAYITVYGISAKSEAVAIEGYIRDVRIKNGQVDIPVTLSVYSTSRLEGRSPRSSLVHEAAL